MMKATLAAALCALAAPALAQSTVVDGPMGFDPIPGSAYGLAADPSAPFILPDGFSQTLVSDEADLDLYRSACASNGLNPHSDWPDMTVSNETKKHAGRYLYRTHEVRPFLYDVTCTSTAAARAAYVADGGGAVSVIDTQTGETKVLAQRADWEALDGLLWTPWHTLLFAEEAINADLADPAVPQATSGLLYELTLAKGDPSTAASVVVRPLLGSLSHEGIETDAEGNVYVIDEDRGGSIYRFVPNAYGDLSSGKLQVLKVASGKTGFGSWVDLDMTQVQISARVAAQAVGGTRYCRPEDLERIGSTLYAALTCEDVNNATSTSGPGAVLAIELGEIPVVRYFAAPGVNVPIENRSAGITGMRAIDNLADGPDGKLWIVEDNVPSDIWVAEPDNDGDGYADAVSLFASLKDRTAEGTGIYFGNDPKTLLVNIQHSETGNDSTIAITKRPE